MIKIKVFIFDIDDTLYDLEYPFKLAFYSMFKVIPDNIHSIFLDFRKYNNEIYDKALNGKITMEELCIYRSKNAFRDHGIFIDDDKAIEFQLTYLREKKNITLENNVENILKILKKNNYTLSIISNGPHKEQFEKFNYLGLEKYIDSNLVFISEDIGIHKPNTGIFDYAKEKILNYLNISDEKYVDFYYIGDAYLNDVIGSKSSGMKSIWINHRGYKPENSKFKPDFIANNFKELYEIIEKIIKK